MLTYKCLFNKWFSTVEIKFLLENFKKDENEALATPVIKMTDPEKVEDLFSKVNEDISKIETKGNIVMYIVPFTYFFFHIQNKSAKYHWKEVVLRLNAALYLF